MIQSAFTTVGEINRDLVLQAIKIPGTGYSPHSILRMDGSLKLFFSVRSLEKKSYMSSGVYKIPVPVVI